MKGRNSRKELGRNLELFCRSTLRARANGYGEIGEVLLSHATDRLPLVVGVGLFLIEIGNRTPVIPHGASSRPTSLNS